MSVLRFIDGDGRERVIDDVNHLFELIKSHQIQGSSLVWDEGESRWIGARDHEFFRRIREIAADSDAPKPSATAAESPAGHVYVSPWAAYKPVASEALNSKDPLQVRESGSRTTRSDKPKSRWVKPIKSREEALKIVKDTSTVFFIVAGIQAIIGLAVVAQFTNSGFDFSRIVTDAGLIDAGLYVAIASWLRWGRSRLAAVLLLLMALISLGATTAAKLENISGGKNIWLALILLWAASKAVEATFKLPEFEKASEAAFDIVRENVGARSRLTQRTS
jgi:hypothetical protein